MNPEQKKRLYRALIALGISINFITMFLAGMNYQRQKAALGDEDDKILEQCFETARECVDVLKGVARP